MSGTGSNPPVQTLVFDLGDSCWCFGCRRRVKEVLGGLEGVREHRYDSEKKQVIVTGTMDPDAVLRKLEKVTKRVRFADTDQNHQQPPPQHPPGVDCNGCQPQQPGPNSCCHHGTAVHPPPCNGQHGQPPHGPPQQPPPNSFHYHERHVDPPPCSGQHGQPPHGPPHYGVHGCTNEPPPSSASHCPPPHHHAHGPPCSVHIQPPPPTSASHCPPPHHYNHGPPHPPPQMHFPHHNHCPPPPPEHNHAPPPPQPPHHHHNAISCPNDAAAMFDNFVHGPASPLIPPNVCPTGLLGKLANIKRLKQVDLIKKTGIKLTFDDGHVSSYRPTSYMEFRPGYECSALPPPQPRYVSPFSDENPNGICSIM